MRRWGANSISSPRPSRRSSLKRFNPHLDGASMSTQISYSESDSAGFFPIVLAVVCGVATGVLWAYANPIQLVPGVIQWRIFAFLPPLIGILLGWRSGLICGYLGTIVWSLLAGTFIPLHSLLVDGIMVGLTGLVPGLMFDSSKLTFDRGVLV